jgi:GNAT superfamily N-acetyltransferase
MPEGTVEVRPAIEGELAAVTDLLVAQLREHRVETPEAKLADSLKQVLHHPERGRILVAVERGRPVGMAAVSFVWPLEHGGRSSWLEELYVEPVARGRGIGTRLLEAALRVAAEAGAVAVDLEVDADHQRVAGLYARHGFHPLPRARWVRSLEPVATPRPVAPAEIVGGCFCGVIRYRVSAPPGDVAHCHCGICRRTTGAPFVTWATFPGAAFAFTAGVPARLRATPRAVRELCAACGTALTFRETARPNSVDVTVGSMDRPDLVVPGAHIWTSSQLPWVRVVDDLPRHAGEDPTERDLES